MLRRDILLSDRTMHGNTFEIKSYESPSDHAELERLSDQEFKNTRRSTGVWEICYVTQVFRNGSWVDVVV